MCVRTYLCIFVSLFLGTQINCLKRHQISPCNCRVFPVFGRLCASCISGPGTVASCPFVCSASVRCRALVLSLSRLWQEKGWNTKGGCPGEGGGGVWGLRAAPRVAEVRCLPPAPNNPCWFELGPKAAALSYLRRSWLCPSSCWCCWLTSEPAQQC